MIARAPSCRLSGPMSSLERVRPLAHEGRFARPVRWRTRLSLDDSLVRLRRLMPQLSRSALYRCLERNGLSKIGRTNVSPPLTSARAAVVITSADELPSLMGLAFDVGF